MKLYLAHRAHRSNNQFRNYELDLSLRFDQLDQVRSLTILSCLYVVFCCFRQKQFLQVNNSVKIQNLYFFRILSVLNLNSEISYSIIAKCRQEDDFQ